MLAEGITNPIGGGPGVLTPIAAGISAMDINGISIAASGSWVSQVFDLGANLSPGQFIAQFFGVASTTTDLYLQCSSDGLTGWQTAISSFGNGGAYVTNNAAGIHVSGRPTARYIRINILNGIIAQSNGLIRCAYLPGV